MVAGGGGARAGGAGPPPTAAVDLHTLWQLATGAASDRSADEQTAAVVLDSRLPRLAAGLLVG
ncbi:hypothetical protein ACFWJY_42005, partial [Streptomyces anulatus]|uniref:hypothetical protein n=1 Tax=Streptomyces anulatus TaxID=1892 RepID=UPI00364FF854